MILKEKKQLLYLYTVHWFCFLAPSYSRSDQWAYNNRDTLHTFYEDHNARHEGDRTHLQEVKTYLINKSHSIAANTAGNGSRHNNLWEAHFRHHKSHLRYH
jgi:hypothetical protein